MQFYQVQLRAVAFVLAETILRKARAKFPHQRVPRDLRDHARGRDAQAQTVAVDNRGLRKRKGKHRQAIDEYMVGPHAQRLNGGAHRLVGGAQDIDRIDLDRIDDPNGPRDRIVRGQLPINFLAFLR